MDTAPWTIVGTIAAILAVLVPIYHRWVDQHRRYTITIEIVDPRPGSGATFEVRIRNDGTPDLIFPDPATVRIFDRSLAGETSVPLAFKSCQHGPPCRIQSEEELTSYTTVSGLADALRMRGCM